MLRMLASTLLGLNVLVFVCLTLLMFQGHHPALNLVPFRSIAHDWREGGRVFVVNFVGNLAIFLPIGFLAPLARARPTSGGKVAALCLLLSGSIEALQYLSGRRVADIDDILLNTLGGVVGYLLFRASPLAESTRTG